jgi:AcrR family transcriptional regulator
LALRLRAPNAVRRGGRPTREQAAALEEKILAVATELFFSDGFGATSIEALAARAGISKRTFYARFRDKAELFRAVFRRLIARWLPPFEASLQEGGSFEALLVRAARHILSAALSPEALALYRLLIAETPRFPELAAIMAEQGASQGVARIAALLQAGLPPLAAEERSLLAALFIDMVISIPRRRALGFGAPMSAAERDLWAERAVRLFLHGCAAPTA